MVSAEVQGQLNDLILDFGRSVLADPADLEMKIAERIGQGPEISPIIAALKAGVPQSLVAGSSGEAMARKLQHENFMAPALSENVVQAWATALGIAVSFSTEPDVSIPLHDGPPLPHIEVVEPPSMRTAAVTPVIEVQSPTPGAKNSPLVMIVVATLVIAFAGLGFVIWRRSQDVLVAPPITQGTSSPAAPNTTGAVKNPETGTAPALPGDISATRSANPPVQRSPAATAQEGEMRAYNVKLAQAHAQFNEAGETFKAANESISSKADLNSQFDQAAPMWDTYSQSIERIASDLEAVTPPADVSAIHQKIAGSMRQFASLVEEGAQAARDHDTTAFEAATTKIKDFGTAAGQELSNMIAAAGYDTDQYSRDGTLIKKR